MSDSNYSALLTQICDIYRKSEGVKNSLGVPAETLVPVDTAVACLFQSTRGDFVVKARGERETSDYLAFFEYTQDILEGDTVVFNNKKYIVVHAPDDVAGQSHHKEIQLNLLGDN